MRKNLLVIPFLLLSLFSKAQCYVPPCPCVDSSTIDIYHYCSGDYSPVCGCDGKTYRNTCAAQYWGGEPNGPYLYTGICGNFNLDFVPNIIIPGTPYNSFGVLSIYSNSDAEALIQIYDVYGKIWYVQQPYVYAAQSSSIYNIQIALDGFPTGIYYLTVIINGELQKVKIMKSDRSL